MCVAKRAPPVAGGPVLIALGTASRWERSDGGMFKKAQAVDADLNSWYMGGVERGEQNLNLMNVVTIAEVLKCSSLNFALRQLAT